MGGKGANEAGRGGVGRPSPDFESLRDFLCLSDCLFFLQRFNQFLTEPFVILKIFIYLKREHLLCYLFCDIIERNEGGEEEKCAVV